MNRKDSPTKRTRPVTVSFADEDMRAMQLIKQFQDPIAPPTDSELAVWLARGMAAMILAGDAHLKDLYQQFGKSALPVALLDGFESRMMAASAI